MSVFICNQQLIGTFYLETFKDTCSKLGSKKVREKSRESHNQAISSRQFDKQNGFVNFF